MRERRESRPVMVGPVPIGGGAPISVQSMTNTDTRDSAKTLAQIARLADAGCEIVRVAIPHRDALQGFSEIVAGSPLPVVADVHFDHTIAVDAARGGAAKLRINPGNIGSLDRVDAVIDAAGAAGIPIRIGVNAGSLADEYRDLDWPLSDKLVASSVSFCTHFASRGFEDIVVSAKASSVVTTIDAYRRLAEEVPYPLHVGVTEAGFPPAGVIRSAVGIGTLLAEGIGDTIRVSLTAPPEEEVKVGLEILKALFLRERGPIIISCPTCGRCEVNLLKIVKQVEAKLAKVKEPTVVAIMGCVVNGPGEAREADVGIAAGRGSALIFRKGEIIKKVAPSQAVTALLKEMKQVVKRRGKPRRR